MAIVRDGHEVVPAWRVLAPDGDFLILTRFDPDRPEQRERAFALVPRFMAWKLATGYVLTAETWLGPERTRSGEEAVLTIGVTRHERMAVIRRIRPSPLDARPSQHHSDDFRQARRLPLTRRHMGGHHHGARALDADRARRFWRSLSAS